MFNFHQSRLLKIFTSWSQVENAWLRRMVRGLGGPNEVLNPLLRKEDDSEAMRQLKKSPMLQDYIRRKMLQWIGDLRVPTYKSVTQYYFTDVLVSFVKYFFILRHKNNFTKRQERIAESKQTNMELNLLDSIHLNSPEFANLSYIDKNTFFEINTPDFNDVVKSIEVKGARKEKIILKLANMIALRRRIALQNKKWIDQYEDNVIDSSLVIGARCILRFIKYQREKFRQRKRRMTLHNLPSIVKEQPPQPRLESDRTDISGLFMTKYPASHKVILK